jgi:hypothetical protein
MAGLLASLAAVFAAAVTPAADGLEASPAPPYRKPAVLVPTALTAVAILAGIALYRRRRRTTV